ncbi:MAG: RNA 2',3'-cyclic phosphodiesterase [Prolixibacteraceae bacterium]
MKRLFIGIPIQSPKAFRMTEKWRAGNLFKRSVLKWSSPDNWHVTLIFLGSTPESAIPLLQNLIENSFAALPAFQTELCGVGVFPNSDHPKVLWLGIQDVSSLMASYSKLLELLQENGFPLENKPLKPHLTLGRIKNATNFSAFYSVINKFDKTNFGTVSIDKVILYESISTSEGPVYKPLFVKGLNA